MKKIAHPDEVAGLALSENMATLETKLNVFGDTILEIKKRHRAEQQKTTQLL